MANSKKRLRKSKEYRRKLDRARQMRDYIETPERRLLRLRKTQPFPYHKPLGYHFEDTRLVYGEPVRTDYAASFYNEIAEPDYISNKALSKVYEQLNQAESLRVAWIERQKSIDLATSSIRTLISIARAVKRRDPKIVRAVLKRDPTAADIIKTPSGLWLSYHFGIVPTVSDLHHAMGIFETSIPPLVVEASSAGEKSLDKRRLDPFYREGLMMSGTKIVKLGAKVTGIDKNVQLATSLGLGQPLSVAWELMAFSWLIDYVVNVGEFIKNFEPQFPGLTIEDRYNTVLYKGTALYGYNAKPFVAWTAKHRWTQVHMERSLGWDRFVLAFNNPLDLKGQQLSYVAAVFLPMLIGLKK